MAYFVDCSHANQNHTVRKVVKVEVESINIPFISSIASGTCLFGLLLGVVTTTLGFLIWIRSKKSKISILDYGPKSFPVYEDVFPIRKNNVSTAHNIAYEDIQIRNEQD